MWLLYRVLVEKAPVDEATKEAREIGLKPTLEPLVLDLLQKTNAADFKLECN